MSLLQKATGAVLRLMPEKPDDLIDSKRTVGQPLSRVDGTPKVTGQARFAAEVPFENLAYAALVYSSIARGSIGSMDTAAAEAAPLLRFYDHQRPYTSLEPDSSVPDHERCVT